MDPEKIAAINQEIHTKFPYLSNVTPSEKNLPDGHIQLVYAADVETESGMKLPIKVKVKVSQRGEILNIITSK